MARVPYTGPTLRERMREKARETLAAPDTGWWTPGQDKPKPRTPDDATVTAFAEVMLATLRGHVSNQDLGRADYSARLVAEKHGLAVMESEE